jgi:hypothetical protein
MTAHTIRLGRSESEAPLAQLNGFGNVEVAGAAEMPFRRAGPPTPRSAPSADLSPARTALAAHIAELQRFAANLERTQRPVAKLSAQLTEALAQLSAAERTLANIDTQRAAALAAAARSDGEAEASVSSPSDTDAEAAVDRARRNCNAFRAALSECQADQHNASVAFEAHKARTEPLLLNVLCEEYNKLATTYHEARNNFFDAEAAVLGLLESIGQHGRNLEQKAPGSGIPWLRTLERLRDPVGKPAAREFGPRDIAVASSKFNAVLTMLATDAEAAF